MTPDLLVRGGMLVTATGERRADFAVSDGQMTELADEILSPALRELDASGLHVFPGVLDTHVHLNEPGRTDWEGFVTGTRALAAGGASSFFDMPLNSSPPLLDRRSFEAKRELAAAGSLLDFGLWGGLTPLNLERMDELSEAGVIGFKAFMSDSGLGEFPAVDDATLYEGLRSAKRLGLPLALHAENLPLTRHFAQQARLRGAHGVRDYLNTRPVLAELEAVQRALLYAEELHAPLHLVHLSSGAAVGLVAHARARGVDVTCETCPHYLHFTGADMERLGAPLKCAPPLRSLAVQRELWAALEAGQIDTVGSDHSPAPPEMKTGDDFMAVWGGISGAQSSLSVLLTDGHFGRGLPLEQIAALSAQSPARRFRLPQKAGLQVGADADFALVDLNQHFTLERTDLHDRWRQNPYVGAHFQGQVRATYSRGRMVYEHGRFDDTVRGRLLVPTGAS